MAKRYYIKTRIKNKDGKVVPNNGGLIATYDGKARRYGPGDEIPASLVPSKDDPNFSMLTNSQPRPIQAQADAE